MALYGRPQPVLRLLRGIIAQHTPVASGGAAVRPAMLAHGRSRFVCTCASMHARKQPTRRRQSGHGSAHGRRHKKKELTSAEKAKLAQPGVDGRIAGRGSHTRSAIVDPGPPPPLSHRAAGQMYEAKHWAEGRRVAGVSFAGERAMAGPVIGAAVVLPPDVIAPVPGVTDPKNMTLEEMRWVYRALTNHPDIVWAVASVGHKSIDHLTIVPAMHQACSDAVELLEEPVDHCLVDTADAPLGLRGRVSVLPKGRTTCYSVAAAAIIATAHHRRVMFQLHKRFPAYGFLKHMGRPTAAHKHAIRTLGPTSAHRLRAGLGLYAKIGY